MLHATASLGAATALLLAVTVSTPLLAQDTAEVTVQEPPIHRASFVPTAHSDARPGYRALPFRPGNAQATVLGVTPAEERVQAAIRMARPSGLHFGRLEDTLWARGDTYKASAGSNGFTFIPFLGSRAPRNWPITFQLEAVEVAGSPLALTGGAARLQGSTAVIERGAVEARYHLGPEEVEQTFVVASDGLQGDVDFAIRVSTDLVPGLSGQGLYFRGPSGGVAFGAATVVDGAGRSRSLPLDFDGAHLRYRIPAEFVAQATGEIVLDPLITTVVVDNFQLELTRPDVAYDADTNVFCVIYEEQFSAQDSELFYTVLNGTSLVELDEGYLDNTTARTYDPHIATIASTGRFVVSFTQDDGLGRAGIHVRSALAGPSLSFGQDVPIALADEFFRYEHSDIGGEAYEGSGESYACVVYEQRAAGGSFGVGLRARRVNRDGVPEPTITLLSLTAVGTTQIEPVISKYSGDSASHAAWWIASRIGPTGGTTYGMATSRMRFNGILTRDNEQTFVSSVQEEVTHVEVSSPYAARNGEAVQFIFNQNDFFDLNQTFLLADTPDGLGDLNPPIPSHERDVTYSRAQTRGSLATSRDRTLMTYFDPVPQFGTWQLRSSTLELPTNTELVGCGERRILLGALNGGSPAHKSSAASKASGGENTSSQQVFVVWQGKDPLTPDANIYGALLNMTAPKVAAGTYCASDPNSTGDFAFLSAYGNFDLTTPKQFLVRNLPLQTVGYFITGKTASLGGAMGSQGSLCVNTDIGRYAGDVLNSGVTGRVTFSMDPTQIPELGMLAPAMAGERRHFQFWYRDVNPTPTANFSNAIRIQF